jgi:hypothetical protein
VGDDSRGWFGSVHVGTCGFGAFLGGFPLLPIAMNLSGGSALQQNVRKSDVKDLVEKQINKVP